MVLVHAVYAMEILYSDHLSVMGFMQDVVVNGILDLNLDPFQDLVMVDACLLIGMPMECCGDIISVLLNIKVCI